MPTAHPYALPSYWSGPGNGDIESHRVLSWSEVPQDAHETTPTNFPDFKRQILEEVKVTVIAAVQDALDHALQHTPGCRARAHVHGDDIAAAA